jgi:hypothetical protein
MKRNPKPEKYRTQRRRRRLDVWCLGHTRQPNFGPRLRHQPKVVTRRVRINLLDDEWSSSLA